MAITLSDFSGLVDAAIVEERRKANAVADSVEEKIDSQLRVGRVELIEGAGGRKILSVKIQVSAKLRENDTKEIERRYADFSMAFYCTESTGRIEYNVRLSPR